MIGEDGNAFSIIGRVRQALREAGVERGEIDAFMAEAMSGDYDHLLQTVLAWVSVEEPSEEDDDWNGEWEYASEEE